jgi:alcohol dehydrogenase class IV
VVFTDVTPNPEDREIRAAYQLYAQRHCDVIVALGAAPASTPPRAWRS